MGNARVGVSRALTRRQAALSQPGCPLPLTPLFTHPILMLLAIYRHRHRHRHRHCLLLTGTTPGQPAERLAFVGYGTAALLAAAGCVSALTGDSVVLPLLRALLRALDAVLRVRPALEAVARCVRWLAAQPALREGIAAVEA